MANKRVSGMAFAHVEGNDEVIVVGDKFGDVFVFPAGKEMKEKYAHIMGHTSSIITCLIMSLDGRYLITADRDEKIRVSRFPNAHVIETFCLGHTELRAVR